MTEALLTVEHLSVRFELPRAAPWHPKQYVHAVDDVSFVLKPGRTLGLVGESGCGKTTLGRALINLVRPSQGSVLLGAGGTVTRKQRAAQVQMIFQDPFASLNPRMRVRAILAEPYLIHESHSAADLNDLLVDLLKTVGLRTDALDKFPHEFSGGQRQRIGIARALALHPKLIIADEPVSALDVSIQSQILNLLKDLREKYGLSYVFISHDLAVVEHISDDVAVMYLGRMVEYAAVQTLYRQPLHPYTKALMAAIPRAQIGKHRFEHIFEGDVPSPIHPPAGCHLHPRCPLATDRCRRDRPQLRDMGQNHWVACHHV